MSERLLYCVECGWMGVPFDALECKAEGMAWYECPACDEHDETTTALEWLDELRIASTGSEG